jgi:hypothetical protein
MIRNKNMIEPQNPQCVKTSVMPCFSLEDVLSLYVYISKQHKMIIDIKSKSDIDLEKLALTFTSNILVDILNEISTLVDSK